MCNLMGVEERKESHGSGSSVSSNPSFFQPLRVTEMEKSQ